MSSGGGGGQVDREYNARMATIAEQQQEMAYEYYQYWKSGPGEWKETVTGVDPSNLVARTKTETYGKAGEREEREVTYYVDVTTGKTYDSIAQAMSGNIVSREWEPTPGGVSYQQMEQEQMKSNMELIPKQTKYQSAYLDAETGLVPQRAGLESALIDAETGLVPQRAGLESALIDAETGLVPQRAGLESALIDEQQENIALRKPVTSKFYDEVLKGVDVDERVNLARADVESAYAGAESNARRWASGMGINPASKSYSAGLMSLAKEKAAAKVGATSLARRQAEEESFARLSGAVGLGSA
jgi:hypothetical protein